MGRRLCFPLREVCVRMQAIFKQSIRFILRISQQFLNLFLSSMFPQCRACSSRLLQIPKVVRVGSTATNHFGRPHAICIRWTHSSEYLDSVADLTLSDRLQPGRGCTSQPSQSLHKVEQARAQTHQ